MNAHPAPGPAPLLEAESISKRFPGVVALDGVDLSVLPGEVHALMGQNGAGKSTLIRILTGAAAPDSGSMRLSGRAYRPASPAEAQRLGVAAVYQEVNLVPTLSVAENLFLGRPPRQWWGIDWGAMRRRAREAMHALGVDVDVDRPLGSLPVAAQQMAAVARAVATDARVIIFDEPTSCLDARETERLFEVMGRLRARGLGLVFITHFLDQVYRVSDRITVLRNGRRVATAPVAAMGREALVRAMLGEEAAAAASSADTAATERPTGAVLEVRDVGKRGAMAPVDLDLSRGEVVGLAGLLGSGRTETARLIFGADRRERGTVRVDGREVRRGSPRSAIAAGIGMTPEDRKAEGLFLRMSVAENIAIVAQRRWGWVVSRRRQAALAREMIERLGIRTSGPDQPAGTLSGGNQQKVLLARWMATSPKVLILDEPTRGVDVGAKAQIEGQVETLKRAGVAVLFISAELDEVARRSDRVLVLRDRRAVGELRGPGVPEGEIRRVIAGGAA